MSYSDALTIVPAIVVAVICAATLLLCWRLVKPHLHVLVVNENRWVLLYRRGRFRRIAAPGVYRVVSPIDYWVSFDRRVQTLVVPGQEVLTKDGLAVKLSAVFEYRVTEPRTTYETLAVEGGRDLADYLHAQCQIPIRTIVSEHTLDDLIADRDTVAAALTQLIADRIISMGLELVSANLRDLMIAKELRESYAACAMARKQAQASIERARGETAALRSLANAARMARDNPELMRLRLLQAMQFSEGRKHTFVVDLGDGGRGKLASLATEPSGDDAR